MERSSQVATSPWKPKNLIFFLMSEIRILTCDEELNSPYLRQYQSCIVIDTWMERSSSVLATPWKAKTLIFFSQSLKFESWFVTKSWNHLSFVNISPTLVINTSMERSSQVLATACKPKNLIFFLKFRIKFWLVPLLMLCINGFVLTSSTK